MKTVVTECGKFYSRDDWGTSADDGFGVMWKEDKSVEDLLQEAQYVFPQYKWKIANVKVDFYSKSCKNCVYEGKNKTYMCNVATQDFYCSEHERKTDA